MTKKPTYGELQQRIKEMEKETSKLRKIEAVLQRERNTALQYLDIAGFILVILGADQTVSMINKKGREILGYREEEIVGKNWFDTFNGVAVYWAEKDGDDFVLVDFNSAAERIERIKLEVIKVENEG